MALADGTLLICFLGDSSVGALPAPRVAVWHDEGSLEAVALAAAPARMVGYLGLPREFSLAGAGARGVADRLAAGLASPLPRRSAQQLRAALEYGKTHEWRVRQQLHAELAAQGLEKHLFRRRGLIGLEGATTDVAALVGAARLEEWDRAERLLEAVGGTGPDRVEWLVTEGWPEAVRTLATEAIGQVKARRGRPRLLPAPEPGAGQEIDSIESSTVTPSTELAVVPQSVPWTYRPVRRRGRLRWGIGVVLGACAIAVALALLTRSSPDRAPLAGSWPPETPPESVLVANLTKALPLASQVAASSGDTLLLRVHLPTRGSRAAAPQPVEVSGDLDSVADDGLRVYVSMRGTTPPFWGDLVWIATQGSDYRLRAVPSTTQLVDPSGRVVRGLRNLVLGGTVPVGRLPAGHAFFLDAQYRVARASPHSPGQIAGDSSVKCSPNLDTSSTVRVRSGSVLTCTAHLTNLGPEIVPAVAIRIGCVAWPGSGGLGPRFGLLVTTHSEAAEPAETSLSVPLDVVGGSRHSVEYVPRSSRLFDADFAPKREQLGLTEDAKNGEVSIGAIGPGAENAVFLRFKALVR